MTTGGRILVVGGGGREHVLAWRLARDPDVALVLAAPGNPGMARSFECLAVDPADHGALSRAVAQRGVDLIVIGPEAPLAAGLADALRSVAPVFGPGADGARLESSKWFAKELMRSARVPTPRAVLCETAEQARGALAKAGLPVVLKADGLAAGKGVRVARERAEALEFIDRVMDRGGLGEAGRRLLIEEHLEGEEASLMVVTDGIRFRILPVAHDYKRALDQDRGPNTGGMGACAPSPRWNEELEERAVAEVVEPVLAALRSRGIEYRGVLYAGLMLTPEGLRVLEFNCRFGDPETEVVLPLLGESLAAALRGAARGRLSGPRRFAARGAAVGVALADAGYPEASVGGVIQGLDALEREPGVCVFHAGTRREGEAWRVTGGRAAHVVATAETLEAARERAYAAVDRLGGEGWRARRDIARGLGAARPAGSAA